MKHLISPFVFVDDENVRLFIQNFTPEVPQMVGMEEQSP